MCGIFGLITTDTAPYSKKQLQNFIKDLFLLSESRGKEAAGIAVLKGNQIKVHKDAKSANKFLKTKQYKKIIENTFSHTKKSALIGHTRLVTDGSCYSHDDNQPIITTSCVGVHNGIVTNKNDLVKQFTAMERNYDVDSEIIFNLVDLFRKEGHNVGVAVQKTFKQLEGMSSIAQFFNDLDSLLIMTNNGSIYQYYNPENKFYFFASELSTLERILKKHIKVFNKNDVSQITAGCGYLVNLNDVTLEKIQIDKTEGCFSPSPIMDEYRIIDIRPSSKIERTSLGANVSSVGKFEKYLEFDDSLYEKIPRCRRCLLPETMPFISFDKEGVCNFCNHYTHINPIGEESLKEIARPYKTNSNKPDCIVGLSGGRDSCFAIHYIKTELRMNPIAYTYDWGMVTDLARRNISRMCGKLGIEHILISADIDKNRSYIRKNVSAWLKKPHLGIIPLFMAGDKRFLYIAQQLKKRFNVDLDFRGENMFERTNFKTGFAGVKPDFSDNEHVYTIPFLSKFYFALFYLTEYFKNPAYFNTSIKDTLASFIYYYLLKLDYLNIFSYLLWDENIINSTLIDEYNWECIGDTSTTWRIGDGTAAFYNYIYYTVAGFTENDCLRSNQIRQNLISREEGLAFVKKENRPRFMSLKWYCDTINISFIDTIKIINNIPKLYKI